MDGLSKEQFLDIVQRESMIESVREQITQQLAESGGTERNTGLLDHRGNPIKVKQRQPWEGITMGAIYEQFAKAEEYRQKIVEQQELATTHVMMPRMVGKSQVLAYLDEVLPELHPEKGTIETDPKFKFEPF